MKPSVLLTDGEQRSTLAVVRSLGRSGYRVYVCSRNGRSLAGASRYAVADASVVSPLVDPRGFAQALRELIDRLDIEILLPMSEESFNAVFSNAELFRDVGIPAADAAQFREISDKQKVMEVAASCGLSVPSQVVVATPEEGQQLPLEDLPFPLVVKPARSVVTNGSGQYKRGAIHCSNVTELRTALSGFPAATYPLLLQQRVVGPGVGVFMLLWDDQLIASFAHRRLREKPPAGGVSVYRESIAVDDDLLARSRALLTRFGWRGVAMIEYKLDSRTGVPFIMEINGRFWGSLQLAIDAGVDFPSLLLACARGESVRAPKRYKIGVRSRWEWGGVDYLWARLSRSDRELALAPRDSGKRMQAILQALIPWKPGDRLEVLRLSDPNPFLRETREYFRQV